MKTYKVTNSNASATQLSSCRVKLDGVTLVVMHFGSRSNPLGYIRNNPQSVERKKFVAECLQAGISHDEVLQLLKPAVKKA